jgi:hypothetical protein
MHQDVEHLAILVHRPPQIDLLAVDLAKHFIQMPRIAAAAALARELATDSI